LSWTFWDAPVAISTDRSVLLSTYSDVPVSEEGFQHVIAVVQSVDRPGAKILGEFAPLDLSSDGQLALGFSLDAELVVAPTGAGLPRRVDAHALELAGGARWLPDRKRIVLMAKTQDEPKPHLFLVTEGGPPPTKVSEAVVLGPIQVSPDGHLVATRDQSRKPVVISLDDGTARAVPGVEGEPIPSGWGPDGSLWLEMEAFKPRAELVRVDVRTGRVLQKTTLAPADLTGVTYTSRVVVAPDGKGFAYSYKRDLGSLFILKELPRRQ
jgi:hypothetical protein